MNLFEICAVAFLTVMVVLSILALSIRLLTRFVPVSEEHQDAADPATPAAVQAALQQIIPGARLIRMERRH